MPVNIPITSNIHDYRVIFEETPDFIYDLSVHPQACFVVDENVWNIYRKTLLKDLLEENTIILPINEDQKNLETVQKLYDRLVTHSAKRNLTLISFGGGILQDITGFTASTIYRGINWIYVPTTLLAQADSCIGSKTSLNYRGFKNLVGTFFPPIQIHIYSPFLNSLRDVDFYSGFGEVIKLYLMGGKEHYHKIVRLAPDVLRRDPGALYTAIQESLRIKLRYMEGDEFDAGRRNLLNFGHDFGHALESTSNFTVPHGQAVIFGMLAANCISRGRSLLDREQEKEIAESLLIPNLLIAPSPNDLEPDAIINAMRKDKKRTSDQLALIMMTGGFDFIKVNDVRVDEVCSALEELKSQLVNKLIHGLI